VGPKTEKKQRVQYILHYSLAKTLSHKFQTSIRKVFRKHGYSCRFSRDLPSGKTRAVEFKLNTDWRVNKLAFSKSALPPDFLAWHRKLRTRSELDFPCLICGAEDKVSMHHLRRVRKMGEKKPTSGFLKVIAALNRKQVPVCEECHPKIHRREYDSIRVQDLAYDFAARRPT
jgi:hypothetical protein